MNPKTLNKLAVPAEKDRIFVWPEYNTWSVLIKKNQQTLKNTYDITMLYRQEILRKAHEYTSNTMGIECAIKENCSIIANGHQPTWHHCGILAKDVIISDLAQKLNTNAIHLILDHDISDLSIKIPNREKYNYSNVIPINNSIDKLPSEEINTLEKQEIEDFHSNFNKTLGICSDIWNSEFKKNIAQFKFNNIADFITYHQAYLKKHLEIKMLYLPVSVMSETKCFTKFAISVIKNSKDFAFIYNNALADHKVFGIKPLQTGSEFTELPFWIISKKGTRKTLYVSKKNNLIRYGTESIGEISDLKRKGYSLRPKAVTLTLFVRLYIAHWFIHGIGGSKYEKINDQIIEDYFNLPELNFGTATATGTLNPNKKTSEYKNNINILKQTLRKMNLSPETFVNTATTKHLIEKKQKLIKISKSTPTQKHNSWQEINLINKMLTKLIQHDIQKTKNEIKNSQNQLKFDHFFEDRNVFFGFLTKEKLKKLFL